MGNSEMLYIKCKNCKKILPTGIEISRGSLGIELGINYITCPYPQCKTRNEWTIEDAFYRNGTPLGSKINL